MPNSINYTEYITGSKKLKCKFFMYFLIKPKFMALKY